ncbi:hypothetical protein OPV22_009310 [Ensete ventricosum]|uniref:Uncharacterized protein n=1 Tax=Ensete ventricosum TaxID=4639 RepID=A0AAV8R4X0_ENSVE|nr:hypothetical protein OPV22_009310 [Ensete ventricosum]
MPLPLHALTSTLSLIISVIQSGGYGHSCHLGAPPFNPSLSTVTVNLDPWHCRAIAPEPLNIIIAIHMEWNGMELEEEKDRGSLTLLMHDQGGDKGIFLSCTPALGHCWRGFAAIGGICISVHPSRVQGRGMGCRFSFCVGMRAPLQLPPVREKMKKEESLHVASEAS